MSAPQFAAPSPSQMMLEWRAPTEFAAFVAAWPLLSMAPRGDGHTVLVLPPFGTSDRYTQPLRSLLRSVGYRAEGWDLGHNLGRTSAVVTGVPRRVLELHETAEQPVSLIGWSMGGILAREVAREHPDSVRQVIALGAPFRLGPDDASRTNGAQLYEMVRHLQEEPSPMMLLQERERGPLPVPSTAVYSRSDGVVDWKACVEHEGQRSENVEVHGSHCGLGHNPAVAIVALDRLAQPPGEWTPFDPPFGTDYLFPRRARAEAA